MGNFFVELSYVETDVGINRRKFAGFHGLKITQSSLDTSVDVVRRVSLLSS